MFLITISTWRLIIKKSMWEIFHIYRLANTPAMVNSNGSVVPYKCASYKGLLQLLWDFLFPSLLVRQ